MSRLDKVLSGLEHGDGDRSEWKRMAGPIYAVMLNDMYNWMDPHRGKAGLEPSSSDVIHCGDTAIWRLDILLAEHNIRVSVTPLVDDAPTEPTIVIENYVGYSKPIVYRDRVWAVDETHVNKECFENIVAEAIEDAIAR